jgi:hypothetical protein
MDFVFCATIIYTISQSNPKESQIVPDDAKKRNFAT